MEKRFLSELKLPQCNVPSFKMINFIYIFARVTPSNEEKWIPIIKSSYPNGRTFPDSRIVVCELHFNENEIVKVGGKKKLLKNAVPRIL